PLRRLEVHLTELARGQGTSDPIGVAVKLFGHEFTDAVHRERMRLWAVIRGGGAGGGAWDGELLAGVRALAARSRAALDQLRAARRRFAPFRRVAPDVWAVFQQTDEYASLFLDDALATLAHELSARAELFDGSGRAAGALDALASCAAREAR